MSIQINHQSGRYSSLAVLLANAPAVAALQTAAMHGREALQGLSDDDCGYLSSLAESAQIDVAEILSLAAYAQQAFHLNRPLSEWLDARQLGVAVSSVMHFAADTMVLLADLRDTAACEAAYRQRADHSGAEGA